MKAANDVFGCFEVKNLGLKINFFKPKIESSSSLFDGVLPVIKI